MQTLNTKKERMSIRASLFTRACPYSPCGDRVTTRSRAFAIFLEYLHSVEVCMLVVTSMLEITYEGPQNSYRLLTIFQIGFFSCSEFVCYFFNM